MTGNGTSNLLQNSSIPGAGILSDSSTPKLRKRIWIFVLTIGFLAFVVHLGILVVRLLSVPVIVEVAYRGDAFQLPDLTLCHTGPYSMLRTTSDTIRIRDQVTRSGEEVVYGIKNFWKVLVPAFQDLLFNKYTRRDNLVARNTLYQYGLKYGLGHQAHETVIGCEFQKTDCTFLNFTVIQMPNYLNCFTFRPPTDQSRLTSRPGEDQGLSLIIMDADRRNIMTEMETLDFIRGMKVFVHQPNTYPETEAFEVAQIGKFTKISLQATKHYRLDRGAARCVSDGRPISVCPDGSRSSCKPFKYSQSLCIDAAMQDRFVHRCRCVSEEFTVADRHVGYPFCHHVEPKYISKDYERIDSNDTVRLVNTTVNLSLIPQLLNHTLEKYHCHQRTLNQLNSVTKTCQVPCQSNSYTTYTSIFDWPTNAEFAKKPLKHFGRKTYSLAKSMRLNTTLLETKILNTDQIKSIHLLRDRFLRLLVYPKFGHCVRMEETLAYPWSAFLSDVGGILGLWVGLSMITVIEILEWVVLRFTASTKTRKTTKQEELDLRVTVKLNDHSAIEDDN